MFLAGVQPLCDDITTSCCHLTQKAACFGEEGLCRGRTGQHLEVSVLAKDHIHVAGN